MQPIHEREALKRYYQDSERAGAYVDTRFRSPRGLVLHRAQVRIVNELIRAHGFDSALELATGPARLTRDIRGLRRGVGIDASPQMLELAKATLDAAIWELRQADIFELALNEQFPLVYSFRFIRHLEDAPRARVFERVRAHLLPEGRFVFDAPNVVVEAPLRRAKPEAFPVYDKLWSRTELAQELADAGFEISKLHPTLRWHGIQRLVSRAGESVFSSPCTWLVAQLERWPGREPLEWTVECRRR